LQQCLIAMYFEDHAPPHFHVLGNDGREAQIELATMTVLRGDVDPAGAGGSAAVGTRERSLPAGDLE